MLWNCLWKGLCAKKGGWSLLRAKNCSQKLARKQGMTCRPATSRWALPTAEGSWKEICLQSSFCWDCSPGQDRIVCSLVRPWSWEPCYAMSGFLTYKNCKLSSVQLLSCVWLFVTPWTAARQASLSITNTRTLFKFMSIESVMPSSHLILCRPLLLLPSIFPSIRVFSN